MIWDVEWQTIIHTLVYSESEQEEPVKASGSEDVAQQERQQLMAEINERKRKILREVEVSCALRKLFVHSDKG